MVLQIIGRKLITSVICNREYHKTAANRILYDK